VLQADVDELMLDDVFEIEVVVLLLSDVQEAESEDRSVDDSSVAIVVLSDLGGD
jgi:hypothetical protein